jgi:hypothetical protein
MVSHTTGIVARLVCRGGHFFIDGVLDGPIRDHVKVLLQVD